VAGLRAGGLGGDWVWRGSSAIWKLIRPAECSRPANRCSCIVRAGSSRPSQTRLSLFECGR
jgi:hypothetical protein